MEKNNYPGKILNSLEDKLKRLEEKKRIFRKLNVAFIALLVIFLLSILTLYMYKSKKLDKIVDSQKKLIDKLVRLDGESLDTTRKYANSVKQYVNDIKFDLNGKPLSSDDFIKVFQKIDQQNDARRDSIIFFKSQITIYKHNKKVYEFNEKIYKDAIKFYQNQVNRNNKLADSLYKMNKTIIKEDSIH